MRPGSAPAIVLSGDSAGANLAAGVVMKLLELPEPSRPPLPIHLIWAYPALDFNLAAWMSPEHLAVLHRNESAVGVQAMSAQKDHLGHRGPLSVVPDDDPSQSPTHRRRQSWTRSFAQLARLSRTTPAAGDDEAQDDPLTRDSYFRPGAADKPLKDRVLTWASPSPASTPGYGLRDSVGPAESYTTRLTMTSRAAFVQDRILTPSTMRAMAILYVGPRATPDMAKNYYISRALASSVYCGLTIAQPFSRPTSCSPTSRHFQ